MQQLNEQQSIEADNKQLIQLYRHFHQIPEMGLQQYKTTQFIRKYLEKLSNVQIIQPEKDSELKTGLFAAVRSTAEHSNKAYLFRCDIDALNFVEQSGVEYSSQNGMHHACGHDAHTAIMLLAVKNIAKAQKMLKRDIIICFQPGEEGHGGASKILQRYPSILDKVEHCFAMHVASFKQKQMLLIPNSYVTSNSNKFTIKITGKSAHCMMPYAGIDANYIGCQIVNEIYSLKTRRCNPAHGMAIAVCRIEGGKQNVTAISSDMKIVGTIRSFENQEHQKVINYIQKYTKSICQLNNAQWEFNLSKNWYRAVKNQKSAIEIVQKASKELFQTVEFSNPSFAGEDFCEFSEKRPSCYFNIAVGIKDSIDPSTGQSKFPIHSNKFKLDQNRLWKGCQLWKRIALS